VRAKRSGESALLLLDVVDILVGLGVKYAVIGALAASVAAGTSLDVDIVRRLARGFSKDALEALERILRG